jgi:hypothetical protein
MRGKNIDPHVVHLDPRRAGSAPVVNHPSMAGALALTFSPVAASPISPPEN